MKYAVKENYSARKCCGNKEEKENKFQMRNSEKRKKSKMVSINSKLKNKMQHGTPSNRIPVQ